MALKVGGEDLETLAMDHHGLVAAVCQDLKIAGRIDEYLGNGDKRRVVSPGTAVVAMILNGLGFTNRRLYLTHQFFKTKPIERLLDNETLTAQDLTDYTLGHTLDEIAKYGTSQLFAQVAFGIAIEHNLLTSLNHLDTTSVSVHGRYDCYGDEDGESPEEMPGILKITYGHSKDYRPDLKQLVLSLVVNGGVPVFVESLNGNSSDKASFCETIKKVRAFQKQINLDQDLKWVADSALYAKDKLLKTNDYLWLTRIPETIKEAKELVALSNKEITWKEQGNGYKIAPFTSNYGGVRQRWILVFSQQAYDREKKTLETNLKKKDKALTTDLWHLGNEVFKCEKDAASALKKMVKKNPLYCISSAIVPILKHARVGKPKAGEEKVIVGYRIKATFVRNAIELETVLNRKGRFILGTNDLNEATYSHADMLKEYKEQQNVEGGFRFLKDPWFMADSVFLKSPERIEALMMVMTLCLLVYNVAQRKLRQALQTAGETLPNQLGKAVKNPTVRWVFQIMEGVGIVRFYGKSKELLSEIITNLDGLRKKIIVLFGDTAMRMYGLMVT